MSLIDFLKTGRLGDLEVGMDLKDVLNYLGAPDGYRNIYSYLDDIPRLETLSPSRQTKALYGNLFLSFLDGKLLKIIVFSREHDPRSLPHALSVDWLAQVYEMTQAEFEALVREHDITVEQVRMFGGNEPGLQAYIPQSMVQVTFDFGGEDSIHSIARLDEVPDSPKEPWPAT